MNPRISHALVAVGAFVLGAATLHFVTLYAIAASERRELEEANAIAAGPVDVRAASEFLRGLSAREHVRSAATLREARTVVLGAIERDLATAVDVRKGVYDAARATPLLNLLRQEFSGDARASHLKQSVEIELIKGVRDCMDRAGAVTPEQQAAAAIECPFATEDVKAFHRGVLAGKR